MEGKPGASSRSSQLQCMLKLLSTAGEVVLELSMRARLVRRSLGGGSARSSLKVRENEIGRPRFALICNARRPFPESCPVTMLVNQGGSKSTTQKYSTWYNERGLRGSAAGAGRSRVVCPSGRRLEMHCAAMIERDGRGHSYCAGRGEIRGSAQDEPKRRRLPRTFSLIKSESRARRSIPS